MKSVTQDMRYRQSLLNYASKKGVIAAAIKYKTTRQYVYFWRRRYDGTLASLCCRSHKPNHHPTQHTEAELKMIRDMRRRNPGLGLCEFWLRLRERGYTRHIVSLYRVMAREGMFRQRKKKKKYVPKAYEQMSYPGQRIQIDVKVVPSSCRVGSAKETKLYQYTAIDECTRWRYLEGFEEQSTYSSTQFTEHLIKKFPFRIECVQTDNGFEFTNRFGSGRETLFEARLKQCSIRHKLIKPYTPRHNGKVERSHREDEKHLYSKATFFSLRDYNAQLKLYQKRSNAIPMRPLNWLAPNDLMDAFKNSLL